MNWYEDSWNDDVTPIEEEIADENRLMLERQEKFRQAADYVASAFARIVPVNKVILFGSAVKFLKKEVPRFRKFRREGIQILHECKDVDLAVWVSDLKCLNQLRKARSRALNDFFRKTNIGVAHHQVDVFIIEPGTNRYLGRLCGFGQCPKGKPECKVHGCGATPFLKQHQKFIFNPRTLEQNQVVLLYDRDKRQSANPAIRKTSPQ